MTRSRAADDFAVIRAQIDELRRERLTRVHAADDFPAIRARMEDLRRERAQASVRPATGIVNLTEPGRLFAAPLS